MHEDGLSYILRSNQWANATVDAANIGLKVTPAEMTFDSARQFCRKIPGYDLAMAKTYANFDVMVAYYNRLLAAGEPEKNSGNKALSQEN